MSQKSQTTTEVTSLSESESRTKMSIEEQKFAIGNNIAAANSDESTECLKQQQTICEFYLQGNCRFGDSCFNLHPPEAVICKDEDKKKKKKIKCKKPIEEKKEDYPDKKPSMKTATDVRKRIQWDPELPEQLFSVGYLDRFEGIIEKPFSAFTWEHPALVDLTVLNVPQHRIQYFAYRHVKIWEKATRLDQVFGSTAQEGDPTLAEVMKQADLEHKQMKAEEREKATREYLGSDSEDDDVIVDDGVYRYEEEEKQDEAGNERLRATHFVCVRVTDETVRENVAEVQNAVVEVEPILRSCLMPGELLHLTLAMINISSSAAMLEVTTILQREQTQLLEHFKNEPDSPRQISLKGLSTFGARVLYACPSIPDVFAASVERVQQIISKVDGVEVTNMFDYVPHLTLLKVSRPIARERRSKYISSFLYKDYFDMEFGSVDFNNLYLCSIEDRRGPDGFYLTAAKVEF